MDKGCEQRPEQVQTPQAHAERINGNGTDKVLPNGAAFHLWWLLRFSHCTGA